MTLRTLWLRAHMASIEALGQCVRELQNRLPQIEDQLGAWHDQSHIVFQTTVSQITAIIEAMERARNRRFARGSRSLVDARGLDRPAPFAETEADWLSWSHKFEIFVSAATSGADLALDWAMEQPSALTTQDMETAFGSEADIGGHWRDQLRSFTCCSWSLRRASRSTW